jgi:lantibiotic biosynthesis protein
MDVKVKRDITGTDTLTKAIKLIETHTPQNHSLLGGTLGLVLFYRELWLSTQEDEYAEKAVNLLYSVYESVNNNEALLYGSVFSSGVAGLATVTNLLANDGLLNHNDISLDETDDFLVESANTLFQNHVTDFLHGAFGIVHYFTQKPVSDKTEKYITALAETIQKTVITDGNHAWFPNHLNGVNEQNDDINLGLSHGLCSILLVLMEMIKKYPSLTGIETIVHKGVAFLEKNRILRSSQDQDLSRYPFSISADGSAFANNRLAWCYGDLGPVLVFHRYAEQFNNQRIYGIANGLGEYCSTRISYDETMIADTHFCHGTTGLLQIFHALAVKTGEIHYKRAYKHWYEKTLQLLEQELNRNHYKGKETDLLEGLAGVVLSTISCSLEKPASWSGLLLV